jgi:hypothetical protein
LKCLLLSRTIIRYRPAHAAVVIACTTE